MSTDLEPVKRKPGRPKGSKTRPILRKYDDATVEKALCVIAYCGGNTVRAHEQLASIGVHIPRSTLKDWRVDGYAERYQQIRREHWREIERRNREEMPSIIAALQDLEHEAIEKAREALHAGEVKDMGSFLRNVTTSKGINVDKHSALIGRPTSIVEHRNSEDVLRSLASLGHIEGTAEEDSLSDSVSVPDGALNAPA